MPSPDAVCLRSRNDSQPPSRNPILSLNHLRACLLYGAASLLACPPCSAKVGPLAVPQCTGVRFTAAYLAQVSALKGPGFLLTIANDTDKTIKVAEPFPTSAHFYAQVGGRWLWRASSGAGGALVDALQERGPLVAYRLPSPPTSPVEYLSINAHDHLDWAITIEDNPALRFRPGCERCKNPGGALYRAVLAYAYLPDVGQQGDGLLTCGLRSGPVILPPPQE